MVFTQNTGGVWAYKGCPLEEIIVNPSHATADTRGVTSTPDQWFPLQRRCTLRASSDQAGFARDASSAFRLDERVHLEASEDGLMLLAENQLEHGRLINVVQERYGTLVEFGPLEIRYREAGGVRMEPHMSLRVNCRLERSSAIVADLQWREAHVLSQRREDARVVVRATAPLALLLGYPALLRRLDASSRLATWLAFYARVRPGASATSS